MKANTSTKAFGVGKRESHDSTPFYARKLYSKPPKLNRAANINEPDPSCLNMIHHHSCEHMSELPDCSVALMVTSPPYNVGKDYDLDMTLGEHLDLMAKTFAETRRVLAPGGRIAFNVANLGRKPYIPLNAYICSIAAELGLLMRGEIIWVKGKGTSGSCAWGSWMSAGNPTLRDLHEYILIFSKDRFDRPSKGESTISREEFMSATTSVWNIPPESAKKVGHPAPFPIGLVTRLIHLYTFKNDIVLDPFMGSGTTALAALMTGRRYVGYEINQEYIELAQKRIKEFT